MTFYLADVFLPNATELRRVFVDTEKLEGTLIEFSDSGSRQDAFAVIEVTQKRTVIIPTERLEPAANHGAGLGDCGDL